MPDRFVYVLSLLMEKANTADDDPDRSISLPELNTSVLRESYDAFYGKDLFIYGIRTKTIPNIGNPYQPFTS